MTRRQGPGLLSLALLAAVGCDGAPAVTGSLEEATVRGIVRVRGKPATNGIVSFRASNINRPNVPLKEAKIGPDGTYSVTTLVGQNYVDVTCKELFTPKNRVLIENEQMLLISQSENTLDIDIPPKPVAATQSHP